MAKRHYQGKRYSVNEGRALTDYLSLGPERSLRKLHDIYRRDPNVEVCPSLSTLGKWSARRNWPLEAMQHDGMVEELAGKTVLREQASERADVARSFMRVSDSALQRALEALQSRKDFASKVGDLRELVRIAVEAATKGDVLAGGVSDRTESLSRAAPDHESGATFTDPKLDDLIEQHERQQAESAKAAQEQGVVAPTGPDGRKTH